MKVAFTIVTGHGDRCGKGFVVANGGEKGEDVGEDGVGGVDVESLPVSPLVSGDFATVEADWDDFGGVLDGMAHNQMLMHGVCVAHGRSWKSGRIVSAGLEKRLLAEASATGVGGGGDGGRGRGSDGGDNGIDFVSRTKPNFDQNREGSRYGNVLMIDVDGVEDGETIESVLRRLLDVYPVLRGLRDRFGCWAMPSASSMIFRDEVCARGLGGIHFYFALDSTLCDIDIRSSVAEYFKVMGWAAGVNRFEVRTHEYGAKMYERGIIDFSVFQAERLDFIGGAWCGPGLEQRRGSAIRFDWDRYWDWDWDRYRYADRLRNQRPRPGPGGGGDVGSATESER